MSLKNLSIIVLIALTLCTGALAKGEQIVITGSTTVLPIAQACAEAFMDKNPSIEVTVRGGGSGVGIAALIDGTCNIAMSSREIKSKEIASARAKGVTPTDNIVAWDGIAIVVHKDIALAGLTMPQLKDIFSGKIKNWKDLGGANKGIVAISRDVSSGTFEVFKEKVLENGSVRDDALKLASNQAVLTSVSSTPFSIGYVGLGYITDEVKTLKINNITPTKDSARDKTYPIVRSLHMFTPGKASADAQKFLDFVTGPEGQKIVDELGFVTVK